MVFGGNGVSLNDLGLLASLFTFCIVYLFTLFNCYEIKSLKNEKFLEKIYEHKKNEESFTNWNKLM